MGNAGKTVAFESLPEETQMLMITGFSSKISKYHHPKLIHVKEAAAGIGLKVLTPSELAQATRVAAAQHHAVLSDITAIVTSDMSEKQKLVEIQKLLIKS